MDWYFEDAGGNPAMATPEDIMGLVEAGVITAETLVWNQNLTQWRPAAAVRPDWFDGSGGSSLRQKKGSTSQVLVTHKKGTNTPTVTLQRTAKTAMDPFAIAALVFGLLSVAASAFFWYVGIALGLVAIISGHVGRKRTIKGLARTPGAKVAAAGLVLGYLGTLLSIGLFLWFSRGA